MACTGHSNTPNGVPCTGHVGPSSPYAFPNVTVSPGEVATAFDMDHLRIAIQQELTRRGTSYGITNVGVGHTIRASHYRECRDAINACKAWTYPTAVDNTRLAAAATVRADGIETMKDKINAVRTECVCNCNYACTCDCNYCTCDCNYCVCNCNYCTCDCNYCTCDCNYCTCDCAYSCTCDCNYSDDRLKKDIEYL